MNWKQRKYHLEFITSLFSRGAYEDRPEIRPASIRGQLHWWFRALGGQYEDEKRVFGSVHNKATASKVIVRVIDLPDWADACFLPTLPHKPGGRKPDGRDGRNIPNAPNAPRCAFPTGSKFTLVIAERPGDLSTSQQATFERALNSWLLAGSLGLRSTRGGGAFRWSEAPDDLNTYREQLQKLLGNAPLKFDLLPQVFSDAEGARKIITETVSHKAFSDLRYPLGAVRQGRDDPAPARKTSPLRLTVRGFSDGFRILAVWDDCRSVTGNTRSDLRTAIDRLANGTSGSKPTAIGKLLKASRLVRLT